MALESSGWWAIETALGTRTWQADNEEHARQLHWINYPDEPILNAFEV